MNNDKKSSPVKPYDDSMLDNWLIYDNITYSRDLDICNNIELNSKNLIKFYRCITKDPYKLKN